LIEQAQCIAHAALGRACNHAQRIRLELDVLLLADECEPLENHRRWEALEAELQAARQHRDGQLLRIGGREQELHMRRRLFQRLQQRIE
jgi:hypothetical protein